MFSNTSASGWAEMVFQAKFVLEGVLPPTVGSVGIMGEWEHLMLEFQVLTTLNSSSYSSYRGQVVFTPNFLQTPNILALETFEPQITDPQVWP